MLSSAPTATASWTRRSGRGSGTPSTSPCCCGTRTPGPSAGASSSGRAVSTRTTASSSAMRSRTGIVKLTYLKALQERGGKGAQVTRVVRRGCSGVVVFSDQAKVSRRPFGSGKRAARAGVPPVAPASCNGIFAALGSGSGGCREGASEGVIRGEVAGPGSPRSQPWNGPLDAERGNLLGSPSSLGAITTAYGGGTWDPRRRSSSC